MPPDHLLLEIGLVFVPLVQVGIEVHLEADLGLSILLDSADDLLRLFRRLSAVTIILQVAVAGNLAFDALD
jgi:hypothetical protein